MRKISLIFSDKNATASSHIFATSSAPIATSNFDGKYLTQNIIIEARITLNQSNFKRKTVETEFKQSFKNQIKSFRLQHRENDTELSKEYWATKSSYFKQKIGE